MLKDQMVRIKLKRHFTGQRPLNYIGKCIAFTDPWLVVDGKCVMVARNQSDGVQVDEGKTRHLIPREAIESIRVLPDGFDINALKATTNGQQLLLVVEDGQDVYVGEMGEG
jgi:hypothetical protein